MIRSKKLVFSLILLAAFSLPTFADAAGLIPCATSDSPTPCTLCHFIVGIKGLVDYGMTIIAIAAIVGIFFAGIFYIISTGDESMMTRAKGFLKASLIGFIFVFTAWLIVSITMYILAAKDDLGIGITGWNSFTCDAVSNSGQTNPVAPTAPTTPPPAADASRQLCSEVAGAVCSSQTSCPGMYQLQNKVCAGGQVCCSGAYTQSKPACTAYGGTCGTRTGALAGCSSGFAENSNYDCGPMNVCCMRIGSTPTTPKTTTCQEANGNCVADQRNCPDANERPAYFCQTGVCCVN